MTRLLNLLSPNEMQTEALEKLKQIGLPTKKTEEYRYFDIKALMSKKWDRYIGDEIDIKDGKDIIIQNGIVISMPKNKGITIEYVTKADMDKNHFDPLYYLGYALSKTNIKIHFSKNCDVIIRHIYNIADKLIPYRTFLYIDDNVKADIVEFTEDANADNSFVCSGADIFVAKNANVSLIKEQTTRKNGCVCISSDRAHIKPNATFNLHTFNFGDGESLNLIKAELQNEAHINSYHLLFAKENANMGTVSKIIHKGKSSKSVQKSKNILQDSAKGIFDALIKIDNQAPKSTTNQNSQAILLNDGAFMASKPQLEIYIDDVEASHGSTIGELDAGQLFYLRSRGMEQNEARKMLILAFANEMIDLIEEKDVKETIHKSFDYVYRNKPQIECIATCHNCEEIMLKEKS